MHLIHRKTCRVCGSSALTKVIELGDQYLQGSFIKDGLPPPPQRRIPLTLSRCDPTRDETACGLLQMEHSVPPEVLYSSYWYRSGTNNTMRDHLRGIAEEALAIAGADARTVLDIGCNDGTLLNCYPATFAKFGVDPSDVAQSVGADIRLVRDIFPSVELDAVLAGRKCDIITSIAMYYDLEDPIGFARAIRETLAPNGIWVLEMSYMPTMLAMNSYDTICHEHLEYYSLAVLERIMLAAGLKVFNVSLNNINGGSIRCFVTHENNFRHRGSDHVLRLRALRQQEFDLELDTDKPYRNFQNRINAHRDELSALLNRLKTEGKQIHVYGASTKGNTILQWCGIDKSVVTVAAERNPDKFGARTLGTDIPIVSEDDSRAMRPDYYLVLPWHFKEEFLQREAEMLRQGIRFIFPLPNIEIV
jgi:SAM-dependent methyltransferase